MVGMTTAIVSMNAVVTHWTVASVILNSSMSRGKATDIIVSLRMTTNAATERIPITRNGLTGVVVVEDTAAPTFHTVLLPDHDTTVPR